MNEVAKKQVVDLDGFRGFTDQIEGDEDGQSSSLFQGKRIKFTNDYNWMVNGVRLPDTFEAVVTEVLRCVLKWHPDKTQAPDAKVLGPGRNSPTSMRSTKRHRERSGSKVRMGKCVDRGRFNICSA